MVKPVRDFALEVSEQVFCCLARIPCEVVEELVAEVGVLRHLVVEVAQSLLAHSALLDDVVLHVGRLVLDLLDDLLLVDDSRLPLFHNTVLDVLQLVANRIQMVVVVLDAVFTLLLDTSLTLVHTCMVLGPLFTEDVSFRLDLVFKVAP